MKSIWLVTNPSMQAWAFAKEENARGFADDKMLLARTRGDTQIFDVLELPFSDETYLDMHNHQIIIGRGVHGTV